MCDVLTAIVKSYEPYDRFEAFGEGFVAHQFGNYNNPYNDNTSLGAGVNAQAWDRGLEACSRYENRKRANGKS